MPGRRQRRVTAKKSRRFHFAAQEAIPLSKRQNFSAFHWSDGGTPRVQNCETSLTLQALPYYMYKYQIWITIKQTLDFSVPVFLFVFDLYLFLLWVGTRKIWTKAEEVHQAHRPRWVCQIVSVLCLYLQTRIIRTSVPCKVEEVCQAHWPWWVRRIKRAHWQIGCGGLIILWSLMQPLMEPWWAQFGA